MSTAHRAIRLAPTRREVTIIALATLAAILAVAVTVLILAVTGTSPDATGHQSPYHPLIQYRGTGAAPQATPLDSSPTYTRAEHSYGEVP